MFAKNPITELVKTRLAKDIGDGAAREVYKTIIQGLISEHRHKEYDFCVVAKGDLSYFRESRVRVEQTPAAGELGEKMRRVFQQKLREYDKMTLIGSDTPNVSHRDIARTFELLDSRDVVLGPANDGGYYLVAMKDAHDIFALSAWSHEHVLEETIDIIDSAHLNYALLPEKIDIDTADDLAKARQLGF